MQKMSLSPAEDCSEVVAENRFPLKGGEKCETPGKSFLQRYGRSVTVPLWLILFPLVIIALTIVLSRVLRGTGECPAPVTTPSDPCDDGWIWYMKKCYYFSANITEWEKSQEFCVSRNATLAIIDLRHELDFIIRFKGSSDHWIGLRREYDRSPWLWTNGSAFNNMFPIIGVSDCVLVNSGRISSASCYSDKHWICNKPDAHNSHF
ncbi:C-type lectin domain family 2 member D-like [Bufo gargarizans]|uniref:C-type lectin domain family 2 member D-like n=1 Tax=Bufo gargarizans TaxID=30331 RepID=UPI001CF5EB22|nr:C-type lectin domain family 2 member D-like [Bufo gargarizans]